MITAFDTETHLTGPGLQAPPLVSCAFSSEVGDLLLDRREGPELYEQLLDDGHSVCGHHIAYDNCVLLQHDYTLAPSIIRAYDEDRVTCTLLREQLIDIAQGRLRDFDYGLDDLTKRLGWKLSKDDDSWRLRYAELEDIHPDLWPVEARAYALDDVRSDRDLWRDQERHDGYLADQYNQARAGMWIQAMRSYGVVTDAAFVDFYRKDTQERREVISQEMRQTLVKLPGESVPRPLLRPDHVKRGGIIEPGSVDTKVIRHLVSQAYQELGKEAPHTAKSSKFPHGQVSYSSEVMEDSANPFLMRVAERASFTKILTEEVPILEMGIRGPIHAFYRVLVESGRTGCKNPNLQNRPRRFGAREAFIPRPGYVFAAADFGGLELSTMAQAFLVLLGKSTLAEMINAGIDAHLVIAAELLHISYDEAKRRREAAEAKGTVDQEIENARQTGKVCNFGFPGGLGAERLVVYAKKLYDIILTVEEARQLKRLWLRLFPEMRQYFKLIDYHVTNSGQIVQLFVDRIRGGVGYTDACNSIYQGLGADVAKRAGWLLFKEQWDPRSPLCGAHTVLFPHDEFYVEVRDDRTAHDAAVRLGQVMESAAKELLPDVKLRAKPLLTRRMSKEAQQVRNADGRIVPWDLSLAA